MVIFTTKAISSTPRNNGLSMAYAGLSACQTFFRNRVCRSTVTNFTKESHPDKENFCERCLFMLSSTDRRVIIWYITIGMVDNAVLAIYYINSTIITSFSLHTTRGILRTADFKSVTTKTKPFVLSYRGRAEYPLS